MDRRQRWRVLETATADGLLVRQGKLLTSPPLDKRLATGAMLEELEVDGQRLKFKKLSGDGPDEGWISMRVQGRDTVVREDLKGIRRAIEDKDEALALELLRCGKPEDVAVEVNAIGPPPGCRSVLHEAASKNLAALCRALLNPPRRMTKVADPNQTDAFGCTALHGPALWGHAEACRALLESERFTAVNAANREGTTALHEACIGGHTKVIKLLLDHEAFTAADSPTTAQITSVIPKGATALHATCWAGHIEACRLLMEHPRFSEAAIAATAQGEVSALHAAVSKSKEEPFNPFLAIFSLSGNNNRHSDTVRVLLDSDRYTLVNAQSPVYGMTALHVAVDQAESWGMTQLILDHPRFQAHDAQTNFKNRTALHSAAVRGRWMQCLQILDCPRFTAVNVLDSEGRTALHEAAWHLKVEACKALLGHPRVDVGMLAKGGWTVLHMSLGQKDLSAWDKQVMDAILDNEGFSAIGAQTDEGETALHLAAKHNCPEACRILLEHPDFGGAGLAGLKDGKGNNALSAAEPLSEAWSMLEEILTEND